MVTPNPSKDNRDKPLSDHPKGGISESLGLDIGLKAKDGNSIQLNKPELLIPHTIPEDPEELRKFWGKYSSQERSKIVDHFIHHNPNMIIDRLLLSVRSNRDNVASWSLAELHKHTSAEIYESLAMDMALQGAPRGNSPAAIKIIYDLKKESLLVERIKKLLHSGKSQRYNAVLLKIPGLKNAINWCLSKFKNDHKSPREKAALTVHLLNAEEQDNLKGDLIRVFKDPRNHDSLRGTAAGSLTGYTDPEILVLLKAALNESKTLADATNAHLTDFFEVLPTTIGDYLFKFDSDREVANAFYDSKSSIYLKAYAAVAMLRRTSVIAAKVVEDAKISELSFVRSLIDFEIKKTDK
ncbi:MAG: hypothetical protein R3A13_07735 [Bdellovibrionota bacterium]